MSDTFYVDYVISKDGVVNKYRVVPLLCDPGIAKQAWRFIKLDAEGKPTRTMYDVRTTGLDWRCDCIGFERYSRCKHVRTMKVFQGQFPTAEKKGEPPDKLA